jgi:UPF0271 protein
MGIDLNCDMGESFGRYVLGEDEEVLDFITSANIACGMHAGDPVVMQKTVQLAVKKGVQLGAHPGYPDLQGFGRRNMELSPEELEAYLIYQIGALHAFVRLSGGYLSHVKPHGALYNKASVDISTAKVIARVVKDFDPRLILVGQAGSRLIQAGREIELAVAEEAFPDRAYEADGSLRSRRLSGAVLEDVDEVAENAFRLARNGIIIQSSTGEVRISVDTLCLHGDTPHAVDHVQKVREVLTSNGILVSPLMLPR